MIGLGEESLKGSNANGTQEVKVPVPVSLGTKSIEFKQAYKFTVLSSLPSKPDDVKLT